MNAHVRGFTLLEMLTAISLLGLMLVLVGSALSGSRHALEMADRYATRLTEIRAAQNFLRSSLQQALPLPFELQGSKDELIFEGDNRHLRYVASLPSALSGGLQVHSLSAADDGSGSNNLIVSFAQSNNFASRPWGDPQQLLGRFHSLRLSYRGLDEQRRPTDWMPAWPWPKRLPQYVRIELDTDGAVRWPSMVVALRISFDASSQVRP